MRSAVKLRHAACWASWADAIKMIADRHPEIAGTIIRAVHAELEAPSVQAIVTSQRCLERDGFVCQVGKIWRLVRLVRLVLPLKR